MLVPDGAGATGPPPELLWHPSLDLRRSLHELWRDRELARTIAERDIRARYKQSFFGIVWAVVTPLVTVFAFGIFFKKIGNVETGDTPYLLFAFVGLLPWSFSTGAITSGGGALVFNNSILNKTYCAREVFPLAGIAVTAFDSLLSIVPLAALFVWFGTAPSWSTLAWMVPLLVVQLLFTVGATLALSVVIVYVRDVRQLVGGLVQLGLFLTPVAWPVDRIPEAWRSLYAAVNPFVALIDGYRRCVLDGRAPDFALLAPAAATSVVVAIAGYLLFRRLEGGIADVA